MTVEVEEQAPRRTRTKRRGVGHLVGVGLTAGLLCLVLMVAALAVVVPLATGSQSYTILTPSMEPAYPPGTLVVVRPTDPESIRIGNVITYQVAPGDPAVVTHRVVGVTLSSNGKRMFTTMGDNNAVADAKTVHPEQVRGVVWYALPWIGSLTTLRQQGIFGIVLPLAGGLLVIWGVYLTISWSVGALRRRRP